MPMLDLFDQIQVTEFVRREYDALIRSAGGGEDRTTSFGRKILSLKNHNGRHVRVRYQDILGVGLAQFKAPGAAPALWTHKPNLREKFMEIVDIDEMTRWDPVEMLKLKSPDPNVVEQAQDDLAQRAVDMQTRNEQRTDWMIWEALKGAITIPFPNAAPITVNYGVPAGHFPTFATPWSDLVNADPIEDLWALGAVAIPASGIYLPHHHMSFATHRLMIRSEKIRDRLSSYGRDVLQPNEDDLKVLLRDGSKITVTDDGWIAENSVNKTLNKWIADGKIFTTTSDYRYLGRPIGWVADGWVLVGPANGNVIGAQPQARQGMQSEWLYNHLGQHTLFRQASARMPILDAPEVLAWATAYTP
jgi:hypothetical protein